VKLASLSSAVAALLISLRKRAAKMEQTDIMQKFTIGIGSCNSATIGAPMVMLCATKLTTPKTVATYYVGNNLATET
jgi:hypothetical protein